MRIGLKFAPEQTAVHRRRLEYAFRLFCAIYGHEPLVSETAALAADLLITYDGRSTSQQQVRLSNGYVRRSCKVAAPKPIPFMQDGEHTHLFYPAAPSTEPDWLGEIFEWVSCADEYSVAERDSVGRVPFPASYIGRHGLDPLRPYASIAMALLQRAIQRQQPRCNTAPLSPVLHGQHLIANTHDVDFLPLDRLESVWVLLKYALVSLWLQRSPWMAAHQAKAAAILAFGGKNMLDQLGALLEQERTVHESASYFFLCRHRARRDGNYDIHTPAIQALLSNLESTMEVGVHGSYRSLEQADGLAAEFDELRSLGFRPLGGRQHWLRFTLPQLIESVPRAGAAYDASLGWTETMGFRAGVCSPFPPYDFQKEAPAPFLELPLVIMDHGVSHALDARGNAPDACSELIAASRRYGWGGFSVLWHPTAFGGGQFPPAVGEAYWRLLQDPVDQWLSAGGLVRNIWKRYTTAGLLPERSFS